MKKIIFALLLSAPLAIPLRAQEAPKSRLETLRTWFRHLREGLAESSVSGQYQKAGVTAVAAVRGAGQKSAELDKPVWKGSPRSKREKRLRKEKAELAAAVDLVLDGKTEEGIAALEAFEKKHPDSKLAAEARKARENARELASAKAESSPPGQPAQ